MIEPLMIVWHFVATRWFSRLGSRERLMARQQMRLRRFLREVVRESPFYQNKEPELNQFPLMNKVSFLERFTGLNRHGITLDEATAVALRAEQERDFQPELRGDITVGLSSGTSGARHVFLVARRDRCRWSGQMLARMLSRSAVLRVLNPLAPPLRIAFFLRASSNLYTTFAGSRIKLAYYDLTRPFDTLLEALTAQRPDVLVAPATVLAELARRASHLRPAQIISVAEVLDTRDRELIERIFGVRVAEVYQAAEGFLGHTCERGRLHLNEETLHIEPLWMDEKRDRFQPIITDFSRSSQWFVRYQLDDILRACPDACPCSRPSMTLQNIEGRTEEVLWATSKSGALSPVFPDALRQALYSMAEALDLYRIEQHGDRWEVRLRLGHASLEASVRGALERLLTNLALIPPEICFLPWSDESTANKQKRIRCVTRPT